MLNLCTYPDAPASMHASRNSLSGCNVKKINLAVQPDVWSLRIASIPLKIGISKIVTMTSGHSLQASETSAVPSAAVPTTSNSGDKRAISIASIARLTSANSTRGRPKLCLQGMRRCTPFGLQSGKTGGFKTPAQGYRQQLMPTTREIPMRGWSAGSQVTGNASSQALRVREKV